MSGTVFSNVNNIQPMLLKQIKCVTIGIVVGFQGFTESNQKRQNKKHEHCSVPYAAHISL